ncbi:MAG TPA: ABC transporter ATP-binding protein [Nitrospira sp.]|nr:ABC transporter ATP-binding protein [Nitrospira sp.]
MKESSISSHEMDTGDGGVQIQRTAGDMAIRVQNLSKCYQLYDRPEDRLKHAIYPRLQRLMGMEPKTYAREFWALRDVSFEVKKGETVGIIGRNGSGKSTLLQLICGILAPTYGTVETNGRVAALLELGAGFNPEFTGRENVYMNGALLGLSRQELNARFDAIAAFADIGEFIEQPVKMYSSGMYVRLAFAAAVSTFPDILIVDEALAVGDIAFQAKCMGRIRRLMEVGTTVIFVSHDVSAVKALCNRCLYLEAGRSISYGKVADVTGLYVLRSHMEINAALNSENPAVGENLSIADDGQSSCTEKQPNKSDVVVKTDAPVDFGPLANRYGDGRVTILDVKLLGRKGSPTDQLEVDEPFQVQIAVRVNADLPQVAWGYSMRDLKGQMLVGTMSTSDPAVAPQPAKAGDTLIFSIRGKNALRADGYTLVAAIELPVVRNKQHIFLEVVENALVFRSVWPADALHLFPAFVKTPVQFDVLSVADEGQSARIGT